MSNTDIIREYLSTHEGFHKPSQIAVGVGLESKQVSSALSRMAKKDEVVKSDGGYAFPRDEPEEVIVEEDLVSESEKDESEIFYEFLDFPGNYSIVMAPLAKEIADAAGVANMIESFPGKLTRRVHFGGSDMDLAARTVSLVQETVQQAVEHLHAWQKDNLERRRGLTDMQRYVEHREVLAKFGHAVAKRVAKQGV